MASDQGPCDKFILDYYTDPTKAHRPEHRYCTCGWTQAHHAESATPTGDNDEA